MSWDGSRVARGQWVESWGGCVMWCGGCRACGAGMQSLWCRDAGLAAQCRGWRRKLFPTFHPFTSPGLNACLVVTQCSQLGSSGAMSMVWGLVMVETLIEALCPALSKFLENAPKPQNPEWKKLSSQARFFHVFIAPAVKAIYTDCSYWRHHILYLVPYHHLWEQFCAACSGSRLK